MEIKDVHVWKPVAFTEEWERCSTVRLDAILPSWTRKRQTLREDSREYKVFMERLKRQHAIETGIVEKLYDLSEGVTETFIKEGFVESYLQHGDTNIPPGQLMAYLQDNFDAIDFVFDVVKNDRPITISFIKELHQLITKHQHTAEGRDQFGTRLQIPLLKGAFKERENNPTRADGTRFIYCPPVHVASEMDSLVEILDDLEKHQVKPLLIATWLHHAFVQIHPFQDGNGRLARLLASLVLVKNGLFPLTVKRHDKKRYIDALELADQNQPQELVDYFGEIQKRNIEAALNLTLEVKLSETSLVEVADVLIEKLQIRKRKEELAKAEQERINQNRNIIIRNCDDALRKIKEELLEKFKDAAEFIFPTLPDISKDYIEIRIEEYASKFEYKHNISNLEKIFFAVKILNDRQQIIFFPIHYFGIGNYTIAIGSILFQFVKNEKGNYSPTPSSYQYLLEPFTISINSETSVIEGSYSEIKTYLQNCITLTLAQIASELT